MFLNISPQRLHKTAGQSSPPVKMTEYVGRFFRALIASILPAPGTESAFVSEMLDARWFPVLSEAETEGVHSSPDPFRCLGFTAQSCPRDKTTLTPQQQSELTASVQELTTIVHENLKLSSFESDTDNERIVAVRELILADFLESAALVLFQKNACFFLQCVAAVDMAWSRS